MSQADDFTHTADLVPEGAVQTAALRIAWFIDINGEPAFESKVDGQIRVGQTVGDVFALLHEYLHHDDDEQPDG